MEDLDGDGVIGAFFDGEAVGEAGSGGAGGLGEVEIGLVFHDLLEGVDGLAEGGAAEPSAEDGGGGKVGGGWAGGVGDESAEEGGLGVGGTGDSGHGTPIGLISGQWAVGSR